MRYGRITLVELLVVLAVLGINAALFLPAVGSKPPLTDKELHLEDWQPSSEHSAVPSESLRVRDVDLAGNWTDRCGFTDMTIRPLPNGRYSVSFLSHARCGHSGSVQLERVAEYDDGILLLNRPVRELRGTTYQRLYTVHIGDDVWLLPTVRVDEIDTATSEIPYRGVLARSVQQ